MTPDPDLSARLARLRGGEHEAEADGNYDGSDLDQACGTAYRSGQLITAHAHAEAVKDAVAKAVEAERELFLQMVADRRALYGAEAKRHEGDIEDTCSEWEKIQHTITSYDYFAADIRSRGVKG